MDNDDLRRGKPTNHKVFGEANAILAGDALLTKAFEITSSAKINDTEKQLKAISVLASSAGTEGMIGGQIVDIESENKQISIDVLKYIHRLKTGALIKASCVIGAILGGADEAQLEKVTGYAEKLGVAFQIRDDILDVVGDSNTLGKPIGSDEKCNKNTYVTLLGIDEAQRLCREYSDAACRDLDDIGYDTTFLSELTSLLVGREN
jgi:geranylgeranyl diphosphate synthase type II